MVSRVGVSCLVALLFAVCWCLMHVPVVDAFFVIVGNTTACDICDEYQTYSGR